MSHFPTLSRHRPALLAAVALLSSACVQDQRNPLAPVAVAPNGRTTVAVACRVDVASAVMSCAPAPKAPGTASAGSMALQAIGGQDSYVKLASSGTTYDAGTQVLASNVTVQNLLETKIGTPDGTSLTGVMVFFSGGPTNGVTIVEDGVGTFTASGQSYIMYGEMLEPYQISQSRQWTFNVPSGVATFTFEVYVATDMMNPSAPMLDKVWSGAAMDSLWSNPLNWVGDVLPSDTAVVAIPNDSLMTTHASPKLDADVTLRALRVGYGSALDLAGHVLTASGNVDAVGSVTNGTVKLSGSSVVFGGNLDAVRVTGSASLQRDAKATGTVSVTDGTLSVSNRTFTISIP